MFIQMHTEANYINILGLDSPRGKQDKEYFPA